jgi:hypothetical protein
MSDDAILPGCILHWDGFTLSDGEEGHKYFVVVGAHQDKNFLAILATSRRKGNRDYKAGGNHEAGWYLIPGGGKDFFKKDNGLGAVVYYAKLEGGRATIFDDGLDPSKANASLIVAATLLLFAEASIAEVETKLAALHD